MFLSDRALGARWVAWSCGASLMLLAAGCEPASITEARDQLGRGPARTVQLTIPIAQDTVTVGEFLCPSDATAPCDTVTTPEGKIGIQFDPETLTVKVGEKLKFDNLSFDQFTFGYDQMLQTSKPETVTVDLGTISPAPGLLRSPGVSGDTVRFGTPQGSSVDSAAVATGDVLLELRNGTNCSATVSISVVDSVGTVVGSLSKNVGPNSSYAETVSLIGKTMRGYVRLQGSASGAGLCIPLGTASARAIFSQLTLSAVRLRNVNETFSQTYSPLAGESRITAVDTVTVLTGSFKLKVQNRLPVQFKAVITLNGVTRNNVTLKDSLTVLAAPGGGSTRTDSLTLDLTGVKIVPGAVTAVVEGSATATQATITPTVTTNAIVVDGGGSLEVSRLSGTLDPAKTPELTVSAEEFQEVNAGDFDLGDLEDAVKQATLQDAKIQLNIVNSSGAPLKLSNFVLGVVELTSAGQLPRQPDGTIDYQTDVQGAVTVAVVDSPSVTTLTIARNSTKTVTLQTARVLDRVIDLVLDDKRAAVVGSGSAVVGDGAQSVITSADSISLRLGLTVALDFDVPAAGVTFSKTSVTDGADLEDQDADQIAQRVETASATAVVQNGMPFGVRVQIALVPDSLPDTVSADSVFARSDTVVIRADLEAASVNDSGLVTTARSDTATVSLTGTQARVLLGKWLTAAVRMTLLPSATNTRGAIRTTDQVILRASGSVRLRSGGAP